MSLLRMLAAASSGVPIVDPPPDPEPPTSGWPSTADATLLALRPSGRVVASAEATDSATRDTAATALLNAVYADARTGFGYWDGIGPDYRTDLFLVPGNTYTGGGNSDWRAIVGTNPATRTLIEARNNSGGVIHSFGSIYMENLHLRPLTTVEKSAPKYPWHITGGEMCVAARCTFDLSAIEADTIQGGNGIAGWVGADGKQGMTIIFYKCDFIAGPIANTLNIHGQGSTEDNPMTLAFIDCTGLNSVEVFTPGADVTASGERNRFYIINTPMSKIGGNANTDIYTDGAAPAMALNAATITRGTTAWDVPEGGLSDLWADYYYPSSIGVAPIKLTPTVSDAAPMQPVAGRTYITRIRNTTAMRVTHSGVTVTTAGGQVSYTHIPADSPYLRNEAASPAHPTLDPLTVTSGDMTWKAYYAYSRYPGDNGFWHKVRFTGSSAVRVTGSAQLAGLTDCYYSDDGVTLVPVAAGTPHPLPFIKST